MTYRNVKLFEKYTILATDGEIGSVHDFLFDDTTWTIRYIVVDTRKWLPGRKVLLSPKVVEDTLWDKRQFQVNLTQEQVKESPNINAEPPVSVQRQIELHDYYNWPYYWTPVGLTPIYPVAGMAPAAPPIPEPEQELQPPTSQADESDPHLRSVNEVIGYHIDSTDGEIGHVEDFLADNETWALHYMVVDTKNWLPGRKVLVSPEWITNITWADRKVVVKVTQEAVKNSPEYDPETPITPEKEDSLLKHYDVEKIRPGLVHPFIQK